MSKILTTNKYFVVTFILAIILGGMTFGNLPGVEPAAPAMVANTSTAITRLDLQSILNPSS